MSNNLGQTEYIVTKSQMFNAVRIALENNIGNGVIIDELMRYIEDGIETVLEDDCEEMTDEMWNTLSVVG